MCVCVKPLESQGPLVFTQGEAAGTRLPPAKALAFLDTGAGHPSVPALHLSLPKWALVLATANLPAFPPALSSAENCSSIARPHELGAFL